MTILRLLAVFIALGIELRALWTDLDELRELLARWFEV
jgi:hypothetical protein